MKASRQKVFNAIDSERKYQEEKWNNLNKTISNPSSFILWMEHYLDNAKRLASTSDELNNLNIMAEIRKVTALGVAAMECNGAPFRDNLQDNETVRGAWYTAEWEQVRHIPDWYDRAYMQTVKRVVDKTPIEKLKTLFKEEIRHDERGVTVTVTLKI